MDEGPSYQIVTRKDEFCGKTVKTSKRRSTWLLKIDGRPCTVTLAVSAVSGKKRIFLNEVLLHEQRNFSSVLQHSFVHNSLRLEVLLQDDKAELLVGRIHGNQYADAFLALENEYSGELIDVFASTIK